jgi:MFS family permease
VYYSPVVFSHAGISGRSGVLLATILVGLSKTLFILVATVYLDRLGRRPLLLTSAIGMTFSLLALAVGFLFLNITPTKGIPDPAASSGPGFVAVLAILAICSYVAFFSVGFGPIVWVLTSEIFPLRLRAQAMGLAIVVNRLASGTVALTFLSMARAMSIAGTFFLFSAIAALSAVFVYTFTPETKGRTLEEIARFFEMDSDRSQASYSLELGNLPHDGVGVSSPRIRKPDEEAILMQPGAPPVEDEDDLVLLRHDSLMAPQSGASRKELMMKVKAIKKQGQNSSASSRSQSQRPPPETLSVPPRP